MTDEPEIDTPEEDEEVGDHNSADDRLSSLEQKQDALASALTALTTMVEGFTGEWRGDKAARAKARASKPKVPEKEAEPREPVKKGRVWL